MIKLGRFDDKIDIKSLKLQKKYLVEKSRENEKS